MYQKNLSQNHALSRRWHYKQHFVRAMTLQSCLFFPVLFSVLEGVSTWKTVIGRATFSGSAAEASLSLAGALVAGAASTTP